MIEIKITYGTDIDVEAPTLRKLAAALLVLAGDNATTVTASSAAANVHVARHKGTAPAMPPVVRIAGGQGSGGGGGFAAPYGGPVQGNGAMANRAAGSQSAEPGWKIAPNDVPDVGAEDDGPLVEADPAQVFGAPVVEADPAQVFGHGSAALDADAAKLEALAGPGAAGPTAAQVFGGNAPGATSPTPSGTPAAPNSGVVTGGVNVDSRGLPWDGRIHAGTKTTNKDGSWKKKPNVEADLVAQVERELRAVMAIPAPNAMRQESAETATTQIDRSLMTQALALAGAPATPPVSVPPPPPASVPGNVATPTPPVSAPTTAAGVASSITGFHQLLPAVTNALASGRITEQDVADVLAQHGVAVLPQLAPRPDLVQSVAAALGL